MTRSGEEQRPMYLTEVGRRHLEDRLGEYAAQRARLTAQSTDPTDVQDSVDQSDRLEAEDELGRLDDHIAQVQDTLRRALPLPAGAADGVMNRKIDEERHLPVIQKTRVDQGHTRTHRSQRHDIRLASPQGDADVRSIVWHGKRLVVVEGVRVLQAQRVL